MKKYLAILLALVLCFGLCACGGNTAENEDTTPTEPEAPQVEDDGIMKILLIGHSLGTDSSYMFPDVCRNEGMENLIFGRLYHSGCRVGQHMDYAKADAPQYSYDEYDISKDHTWQRAYSNGTFFELVPGTPTDMYIEDGSIAQTMKFGIQRHDWDLVILQAGLFESANIKDSYFANREINLVGDTKALMDYVLANDIEPGSVPQFAWNMIWSTPANRAVRKDSTNQLLDLFCGGDDHELYLQQTKFFTDNLAPAVDFAYLFPNGTAIENLKTTKLADNQIFRDYAHATDFGRLVAAYTWYCILTDTAIEDCKIAPMNHKVLLDAKARNTGTDLELTEEQKAILIEAVGNAIKSPYETIQSQYAE